MNAKSILKALLLTLATSGFVACGGEEPPQQEDPISCGEGTIPFGEQCIVDQECPAGEVQLEDGRCIRGDYCGADTTFDANSGRCTATTLRCGSNTTEESGECVPELIVTCGDGTVSAGTVCTPYDDICGPGTQLSGPLDCRPAEEICGEGTVFDVNEERCIPISSLTCGPGTTTVDSECIPASAFYADLAANADISLSTSQDETLILKAAGERAIFAGSIAEPVLEGNNVLENHDRIHFEAEAGQWLRLVLYSQGVPDLGFVLTDNEDFSRQNDRGSNIEITRDLLIPADGSYELQISSLPQLLGDRAYNGGEGWDYVGYIEVVDAPDAEPLDITNEPFSGNVATLRDNLFLVEGVDTGTAVAMTFSSLPLTAKGEILVFNEDFSQVTARAMEDVVSFDAPSDPFYLVVDRSEVTGSLRTFTATARTGLSLAAGESYTIDVDLEPGDYVGLFQFNLDGRSLRAAISDADVVLKDLPILANSDADSGERAFYYYSEAGGALTLELENTSSTDLGFFSPSFVTGSADHVDGIDGSPIDYSFDGALAPLERHYITLAIDYNDLLGFNLTSSGNARLILLDENQDQLVSANNGFVSTVTPGDYLLAVEALEELNNGFDLHFEESQIFEVSESSSPGSTIEDNTPAGTDDVITIGNCTTVTEIDIDVDISHIWVGDVVIKLTSPGGETKTLRNGFGGSNDDIIGNFNETLDPEGTGAVPASDFIGESGTGDWTLNVADVVGGIDGTLNSWGINLTCEG